MLKTKMQSPTNVIITSIAAASGSRTNPRRNVCSPNVNQVKFRTARNPGTCSVAAKASTESASATTWPITARAAAFLWRAFDKLRITSEAASGTAGIIQR